MASTRKDPIAYIGPFRTAGDNISNFLNSLVKNPACPLKQTQNSETVKPPHLPFAKTVKPPHLPFAKIRNVGSDGSAIIDSQKFQNDVVITKSVTRDADSTLDLGAQLEQKYSGSWIKPVTKEEVGRATWTFLHALAAQFPDQPTKQQMRDAKELMAIISRLYPCKECQMHFQEVIKANPVQAGSGLEFSQWMCKVHNIVNRSLGKPTFPCNRIDARWGAIACDGVCDLQGRTMGLSVPE